MGNGKFDLEEMMARKETPNKRMIIRVIFCMAKSKQ